ncbi:MAG TPA: anti-sigma factor [Gaiellaceae bacterium]|nr:anti-sigma factor [Gaiellaceae bacterium]
MNRDPSLDELIGVEVSGAERERLQHVHELLLQAGPPPEVTPELASGPTLSMTLGRRRRAVKPRAMLLLAAALATALVFFAGYIVANNGGSTSATGKGPVQELALRGTSVAPGAQATLKVWQAKDGSNWPMTMTAAGLPKLPGNEGYEVYLVRHGRPWLPCGTFRVTSSSGAVTVTLNAPYSLRRGDSWVVTRPGAGGTEPGKTVLQPVSA